MFCWACRRCAEPALLVVLCSARTELAKYSCRAGATQPFRWTCAVQRRHQQFETLQFWVPKIEDQRGARWSWPESSGQAELPDYGRPAPPQDVDTFKCWSPTGPRVAPSSPRSCDLVALQTCGTDVGWVSLRVGPRPWCGMLVPEGRGKWGPRRESSCDFWRLRRRPPHQLLRTSPPGVALS